MNKLRENAFWAGLAAAGGLLLILYVMLVMDVQGQAAANARNASNLEKELAGREIPSQSDIDTHVARRESLRSQYKDITNFYVESDRKLESWLPGLSDPPARDGFMTKYRDAISKLEGRLKEQGVQVGIPDIDNPNEFYFGFRWEVPTIDDWTTMAADGGSEVHVLKTLQKRYWIRERVANVILGEGGRDPVKVSRIQDFHFFGKIHPKLQSPPWAQRPSPDEAPRYKQMGMNYQGFAEHQLPGELGNTITFGFGILLPNSEVPKFIKEFLNPASDQVADQRILLHVLHTDVVIRSQNPDKVKFTFKQGNLQEREANRKKALEQAGAKDVMLSMTCQVIDFNPEKVDDFAPKEEEGGKKKN